MTAHSHPHHCSCPSMPLALPTCITAPAHTHAITYLPLIRHFHMYYWSVDRLKVTLWWVQRKMVDLKNIHPSCWKCIFIDSNILSIIHSFNHRVSLYCTKKIMLRLGYYPTLSQMLIFSRVHATLQPTLSVCRSVKWAIFLQNILWESCSKFDF